MVASILDLIPTEYELDRRLCVAERERDILLRLIRVARIADRMREIDARDRAALAEMEAREARPAKQQKVAV